MGEGAKQLPFGPGDGADLEVHPARGQAGRSDDIAVEPRLHAGGFLRPDQPGGLSRRGCQAEQVRVQLVRTAREAQEQVDLGSGLVRSTFSASPPTSKAVSKPKASSC